MKLSLRYVKNLKSAVKKGARPKPDATTTGYPLSGAFLSPLRLPYLIGEVQGESAASSGQIDCQSSGRNSLRVTFPAVATSIAAMNSVGTSVPRTSQVDTRC